MTGCLVSTDPDTPLDTGAVVRAAEVAVAPTTVIGIEPDTSEPPTQRMYPVSVVAATSVNEDVNVSCTPEGSVVEPVVLSVELNEPVE